MFSTFTSRRFVVATLFALFAVPMAASADHEASPRCRRVHGKFFPTGIEIDGNPQTLEFEGPVTGPLHGHLLTTELVLAPGRSETPSVLTFTELLAFTTDHGEVLKGTGVGSFDADPLREGLFTEVVTLTERNGVAGFFGQMFIFGSFDFAANLGAAEYSGEVCK